jgi:rod shape-determining protein MreB
MEEEKEVEVKGHVVVSGLPRSVVLTSSEIARAIRPELLEMIDAIKRVLQDTPPELSSDIIDHGITLTGGTSLLRLLPELIEQETNVPAGVAPDALLCVAKGTGTVLDHLDVYKKRLLSK